jgi:hypothetical protein
VLDEEPRRKPRGELGLRDALPLAGALEGLPLALEQLVRERRADRREPVMAW